MVKTPLLRPLRDNGATLYIFPSASEDIGLNIDSRATGVSLSHYALLNFPNSNLDSITMAEELQNYVMNFECVLLNNENYNYQAYHTVSERVFWHWALKKGFLTSLIDTETDNEVQDFYYHENKALYDQKKRFVQCFGSIDAGNSLSTEFGMFNETYVNIPTSYGNGPVFFKEVQDPGETNYIKNKKYSPTESDILEGRTANLDTLKILENSTPIFDNNSVYEASDAFEIVKEPYQIQTAIRNTINNDKIIINSYDDINIDNKEQFKSTLFDITTKPCEFSFNAILLYYSIYDQDDTTKAPYAVNLFGIIFLDGINKQMVNDGESEYNVRGYIKRKSFTSLNAANFFGNSYSFRVNLKTMSVYDNTDAVIKDNTTMSSIYSSDFSDVIANLNMAIDTMNTNVQSTIAIQDQYLDILRYYNDQKQIIDDISTKVNGFINGSKTSSFNSYLLRTNELRPLDENENMIRLTLKRTPNEQIDGVDYENSTILSPIIITNDYANVNVPTVYKPLLNPISEDVGEWTDSLGKIQDVIDAINIKYFTHDGNVYQKLELPESMLAGYGLNHIYKKFKDYANETNQSGEITYINYDGLIPLLITYIKDLKQEIEILKTNS